MRLKGILREIGQSQAALARACQLSPATIAQLVNHQQWPKSIEKEVLISTVGAYLRTHGASEDAVQTAFEVAPPCTTTGGLNPQETTRNPEDENMLLRKQALTPAARKAFGLVRDPFADLTCAEDMYVSPDTRYIMESMYHTARHDGFIAVVGESGAGKSTLRRALVSRLSRERAPVIVIEPYVLAMEDNDAKGKTLKSAHVAEAILSAVAPLDTPKRSPEARFKQLHSVLRASHESGQRHCLIIEEAHCLPIPTLKHLKRLRELEHGFTSLVSIILIGQPELAVKLSERNAEVREVVQRIEITELEPVPVARLEEHLSFRLSRAGTTLDKIIDHSGLQALAERLTVRRRDDTRSLLYPLAIGNLMVAALNLAAQMGETRINADVINEV